MRMTMNRPLLTALAAVTMAAAAGLAVAQNRANVSNQPIAVGADTAEYLDSGFSLRGRAEVQQGTNRLRANAIEGTGNGGQIGTVTASGDVYYVTPNETIRGDRAVYTDATQTIVVTGDVILTQGKNVLTGRSLSYNIDTGAARMDGGGNGRVQGVFYPEGRAN